MAQDNTPESGTEENPSEGDGGTSDDDRQPDDAGQSGTLADESVDTDHDVS